METRHSIAEAITRKIKDAGKTPNAVARAARIPRTTFDRKINAGGMDFTIGELYLLGEELETSPIEFVRCAA